MSTNRRSADYDPFEDAYERAEKMRDEFFAAADSDDLLRDAIKARFQRNTNRAEELRQREARERQRRRERAFDEAYRTSTRSIQQSNREADQRAREASLGYRRERDAQTLAQREQARMDREARYAAADARRNQKAQTPASFSSGAPSIGGPGGPNKESVAKFIILATALAAIGGIIRNPTSPVAHYATTANGNKVKVPAHMKPVTGAFVAGAIALIVNEVYPAAGLVLGVGIVGIVIFDWTPVLGTLSTSLFNQKLTGADSKPVAGEGPRGNLYRPRGNGAAPPQLGKDPNTGLPIPFS